MPVVEELFPSPWTAAARRMLPSPSPQFTATAMWGPILGWCALDLLAGAIDAPNPALAALELFDRLRLRQPFAQAFGALGFEGEESWRVAARIKVVLLTGAGVGNEQPAADACPQEKIAADALPEAAPQPGERVGLPPLLWSDPDVRWLTGVHQAEQREYLIRERYEELLWWMQMPSLLRLAGETAPRRSAVEELSRTVEEALEAAKAAGYRVDVLIGERPSLDEDHLDNPQDGERSEGIDIDMPPLERDEHDEPSPEFDPHSEPESPESLYGGERSPGVDFDMPPLERDEGDAPESGHDPHSDE
jgi:hypothetical protein